MHLHAIELGKATESSPFSSVCIYVWICISREPLWNIATSYNKEWTF